MSKTQALSLSADTRAALSGLPALARTAAPAQRLDVPAVTGTGIQPTLTPR